MRYEVQALLNGDPLFRGSSESVNRAFDHVVLDTEAKHPHLRPVAVAPKDRADEIAAFYNNHEKYQVRRQFVETRSKGLDVA